MTIITRMQMKGFKSFATKTEILFGDRFNCVLGPNGSGKSNILDSLCFVLGKSSAKGLRAEKSANLIYNGGKSKKPASEGEVSIWFSNPDNAYGIGGDEVKITRTIKQSGQSVYRINDKTMTRQQVLELLSRARVNPDGYNIILQGDIVSLVEMSTVDRRKIVEEIAGISIYEEKKEKALRELSRVEERLNEATIILAERQAYLKELKGERDQAQKFRDLDQKIKQNKATLLSIQIKEREDAAAKQQKAIDDARAKASVIQQEIERLRGLIEEKRKLVEAINHEIEEKGEKEQVAMHKQVETLKVSIAVDRQRVSTLVSELEKIAQRKTELEKSLSDIGGKGRILEQHRKDVEKQVQSKGREMAQVDERLDAFRKKHNMEGAAGLNEQMDKVDKDADRIAEAIAKLREEQQQLLRDKDRLEIYLQGIDEKIAKVMGLEKAQKAQLDDLKGKKESFKTATVELSKCLNEDSSLAAQLGNARSKILSRQEEAAKLQTQQARIRESVAGGTAINAILDLKKKGIEGLVSELGQVKKEFALAMEVAAGNRLRSIVVEDDQIAEECINHLKKHRLGVVTFLPLNKIKPPVIESAARTIKGQGVHGLALDLLNFEKKYEKVFQYVFGNTLVVDDVSTARRIGVGRIRMVTMGGDLIETSGAMQGGHRAQSQGSGFQEREIAGQLEKVSRELADLEGVAAHLAQEKKDNEEAIQRLREHKAGLEGEIIKLEKILHLDSDDSGVNREEKRKLALELKEVDQRYERIIEQISTENRTLASLKIEKQKLRDQISSLQNPSVLAELRSFEEKRNELKDQVAALTLDLKTAESEAKNILGPEGENIQRILKQHAKEEIQFKEEQEKLEKSLKEQEQDLAVKEKSEKAFYEQFKGLFTKRSKLTDEANKAENDILSRNDVQRKHEMTANVASLEQARFKAELAGLLEEFKHYEGVTLFTNKPIAEINKEIAQFERMVADIGAVNMKALEIYDRVETEYKKLTVKKDSLGRERENVLVMINEVDSKKKDLFLRTYKVVHENFKRLFASLSTKGEAMLELEDEQDVFNGGLTLKVRLSGTKFMDVRSLSGGEKTLTALAFIFAVQEHEPAPFYILDEVDAALDKKNSERLSSLVAAYAKTAQYIMISHNDTVITKADNLYGISMNEDGQSKITSLKI